MSQNEISSKEIAQAIVFVIYSLEKENIQAWTTTIQKVIFLWLLSKNKAKNFYRAYLYGPYSDLVSDVITRLETLKYLKCDINVFQSVARSYHVNQEKISSEILKKLESKYKDLQKILNKLIEKKCLRDVKSISNTAKVAWIEVIENVKDRKKIYDTLTKKYLWDVSESDFNNAYDNWQEIKTCIHN